MKWKWLALFGIALLLSGCNDKFSPCAFPGAMTVRAPGDTDPSPGGFPETNCLYRLTIQDVNVRTGEIKAKVADSVVVGNSVRRKDYFSLQLFSTDLLTDFKPEDYPPHVYAFHLQEEGALSQLVKGEDYDFENIPDTHFLKICDDQCMARRQDKCREYYKSTPEQNKCGEERKSYKHKS